MYRFLNSGGWIGYANKAERLLKTVMDEATSITKKGKEEE